MRLVDLEDDRHVYCGENGDYERWSIDPEVPPIDAVEVVRCKDCKHRPTATDDEDMEYEFPDEKCPCQCEDCWYSWMPKDDWFCAEGERKE